MKVPLVSPDCEQPDQPARHVLVRRLGQVGHQAPLASHLQDLTLSDGVREQEAESVRVAGVSQGGQHGSLCRVSPAGTDVVWVGGCRAESRGLMMRGGGRWGRHNLSFCLELTV